VRSRKFYQGDGGFQGSLFDGRDCQIGSTAECPEPRAFTFLELPQDTALEVYYRCYPFILIFKAVVCRREYCHFRPFYLFAMRILHFVISSDEQPTILVTESNDLRVFDVPPYLTVLICEPLRESLDRESCRSQAHSHRLG